MKTLFVIFAFCAALALASSDSYDAESSGLTRLPPDVVVDITDDRDSVPATFEFTYEFVVKNIRALAQAARETELTIDFDNRLTIISIDYRCMAVEQGDDDSGSGSYSGEYGSYNKKKRDSYDADSYGEEGYQPITKEELIFTCYLGRVSALGTQHVLATVRAPHVNDILSTHADVCAQNEGQWVTDNNDDVELTAVFDDIYLNQFNRLQTIANRPDDRTINTWLCRFGTNDERLLPNENNCVPGPTMGVKRGYGDSDSYGSYGSSSYTVSQGTPPAPTQASPICEVFNVSAWARCFYNNDECVQYINRPSICNCFNSENQPALFNGFICECTVSCQEGEILTGGGCGIDSAELVDIVVVPTPTNPTSNPYGGNNGGSYG